MDSRSPFILTRDQFWERERRNSELCAAWEHCQDVDPCTIHGHGPSTPCVRIPAQRDTD